MSHLIECLNIRMEILFYPKSIWFLGRAKKKELNWIFVMRRKKSLPSSFYENEKEPQTISPSLARLTVSGSSCVVGQDGAGWMSRVQVGLLAQRSILHGAFTWITGWNVSCSPWHKSFMLRYFQLSGSLTVHLLHHQIPSGGVSDFPSSFLAYVQQYPSMSLASVPCM